MSNTQSANWHKDIAHIVHPYSNLDAHTKRGPTVITRGEGCYVYDEQGKRYFEGMSGLWCASLGFSSIIFIPFESMYSIASSMLSTLKAIC